MNAFNILTMLNAKGKEMKKEATLLEVEKDGEELVLLNGRRLMVNPGDIPTAIIWLPMAELEITENSNEGMFSVKIRNVGIDEEINAMWLI